MAGNTDTFVTDASFIIAYLLPNEKSSESDEFILKYRNQEIKLISSAIFNLEVLNGLNAAELSKRVTSQECVDIAKRFIKLGIVCEDIDDYETFLLAQKTNLTVYDASYVWLAKSKKTPLLSLDKRMMKLAA